MKICQFSFKLRRLGIESPFALCLRTASRCLAIPNNGRSESRPVRRRGAVFERLQSMWKPKMTDKSEFDFVSIADDADAASLYLLIEDPRAAGHHGEERREAAASTLGSRASHVPAMAEGLDRARPSSVRARRQSREASEGSIPWSARLPFGDLAAQELMFRKL